MYKWIASIAGVDSKQTLIICLAIIAGLIFVILSNVVFHSRNKNPSRQLVDKLHDTYWKSLCWFGVPILILNLILGMSTWYERVWDPLDQSSVFFTITYGWKFNPWLDVITNSSFVGSDLNTKSLIICFLTSFYALIVFGLSKLSAKPLIDDEVKDGRFNKWVSRHYLITLCMIVFACVIGFFYLKLWQRPTQVSFLLFPLHAWTALLICASFVLGRVLIPNVPFAEPKENEEEDDIPKASEFDRKTWESYMERHGFRFKTNQGTHSDSFPIIKHWVDKTLIDKKTGQRRGEQLRPTDHLWPHQELYLNNILDLFRKKQKTIEHLNYKKHSSLEIAMPIHTPYGSGKSTAIYAVVSKVFTNHTKSSLVIYPTLARSQVALQEYNQLFGNERCRATFAHDRQEGNYVFFTYAEWIASSLLRNAEDRTGQITDFLENIGLIVYEDIQFYSGIAATNLSILNRRLYGIFRKHEKIVHMSLSMSVNPTELSGAMEFARFICAPAILEEHVIKCAAPSLDIYAYLMQKSKGYLDSQSVNTLPALLEVAWLSRAFDLKLEKSHKEGKEDSNMKGYKGIPVAILKSDLSMISMSDLVKPKWVDQVYQDIAPSAFVAGQFVSEPSSAWLSCIEVDIKGLLSLPIHIEHLGVKLHLENPELKDHLLVMKPNLLDRKLIVFLIDLWLKHSRNKEDSLPRSAGLDWLRDVMPLGNRLVAGHPNQDLLLQHVHSTIHERKEGITFEELRDIFTDSELLNWALIVLTQDKKSVERKSTRVLTRDNDIQDVEKYYSKLRKLPFNLKIWTPSGRVARLTDISDQQHKQLDAEIDWYTMLKTAYPGKLFMHGQNHRYRVTSKHYYNVLEQMNSHYQSFDDVSIPCELTDIQGLTVPVARKRIFGAGEFKTGRGKQSKNGLEPIVAPTAASNLDALVNPKIKQSLQRSIVQEVNFGGQLSFVHLRVALRYEYEHLGYLQLKDTNSSDEIDYDFVAWEDQKLIQKIDSQAYMISFSESAAFSASALETFRRMFYATFNLSVQLKSEEFDIIMAQNQNLNVKVTEDKEIKLSGTALFIVDPYPGGRGLLDALGASPTAMFKQIFTFMHKWASALKDNDSLSWDTLGVSGIDYLSPDLLAMATKRYRERWMNQSEASMYKAGDGVLIDPNSLKPDLDAVISLLNSLLGESDESDS